jgi:hypothetical protein
MDLRTKEKELAEALAVANHAEQGFNFLIGDPLSQDLMDAVFGSDTKVEIRPDTFDMFDILTEVGAFKSKGDARKNWVKSDQNIDTGCHSFLITKKLTPLFIFKPIK